MASVAALNVRIGGDIKALEKALKDAERAVRTAGTRLSNIGNELSMKLSLPLWPLALPLSNQPGKSKPLKRQCRLLSRGRAKY